jgi:hypothetical protein
MTEFATVKLDDNTAVEKLRDDPEERVSNATSDGELTRVSTLGVRVVLESDGNTR